MTKPRKSPPNKTGGLHKSCDRNGQVFDLA
ncbi:hypothetical protein TH47_09730 [Thalassospira sp. MCCC 1A02803]|nr:hypothetical protein TH47_09730 [Thalassospira sp. MCCC 1A02803]